MKNWVKIIIKKTYGNDFLDAVKPMTEKILRRQRQRRGRFSETLKKDGLFVKNWELVFGIWRYTNVMKWD